MRTIEITDQEAEQLMDFLSLLRTYIEADPAGPGLIAQHAEWLEAKLKKQWQALEE